jgi:nitrate reductase assembly molybdenum cofactor insertion protein NarJ
LERSAFEDWSVYSLSRQNSMLEKLSEASMNSDQLDIADVGTITFKVLLERLQKAEKNYEQLHAQLKQDVDKKPKKGLRAF